VAKTAQVLKGKVPKKKFVLPRESWISLFFKFFFLLMVLYGVIFNLGYEYKGFEFFKEAYKFHDVGILMMTLLIKNNSISIILINLKLKFEPCVFNLI
jgi:hypothetical protein